MVLVFIIAALACAVSFLAMPVFETTALVLLLTPLLARPLGSLIGLTPLCYLIVLIVLLAAIFAIQKRRQQNPGWRWRPDEMWPIGVWIGAYIVAYSFCLLWPDFISIGERLRDYAILSSVVQHPLLAREPWMTGATLNYYLYWYRVGHFLSSLGGLAIWDTYHALAAFTFSLYLACFFRLTSRCLAIGNFPALACASLIAFGSNVSGVWIFLKHDSNWWAPSRVVPGAINEFPAWSFLLGDLHPHFLNLALLPLLVLILLSIEPLLRRSGRLIAAIFALMFTGVTLCWVYGANAWEVPFAADAALCLIAGSFVLGSNKISRGDRSPDLRVAVALIVGGLGLSFILHEASSNIVPPGDPFRVVVFPFAPDFFSGLLVGIGHILHLHIEPSVPAAVGTSVVDLLNHWGFPLSIISAAMVILSRTRLEAAMKVIVLLFGYLSGSALLFLLFLILLAMWRFVETRATSQSYAAAVAEMLGIAALLGILFPEVLFIDDAYGGENERMNTIFKFYSASWGFLHLYAFCLATTMFRGAPKLFSNGRSRTLGWILILSVALGFFITSIKYRMSTDLSLEPYSQGLSGVEHQYPGAGVAIQKLEQLPRGTVIEAQVGAYDYSSMVATLSGNEAFLGWANHIQLLTKQNDEVARRQKVTTDFFKGQNCADRAATMKTEGIRYAVVGTLEHRQYGQINPGEFACLTRVIDVKDYAVYEVK